MRILTKILLFFFFIGINISFISLIKNDIKKNSITYAYLCKYDYDQKSQKNKFSQDCFSCTFKKDHEKDCTSLFSNAEQIHYFLKQSNIYPKLVTYFKYSFQKTRAPPFLS
tara:strand:+ start:8477 stop:8809 length:333 start_codon:yes stop_codon:yes gene_type:complete